MTFKKIFEQNDGNVNNQNQWNQIVQTDLHGEIYPPCGSKKHDYVPGNIIINSTPSPGMLLILISPPWALMIS